MQDVERVARALCEASGKNPDKITPAPRGVPGMVPLWTLWEKQATAAISAMPDSFDRGWNAAIDELERQDGFGEWADAAKFMRQLKKDTGHE